MVSILAETGNELNSHLTAVMAANLVIWAGIVIYLLRLELKLRKLERRERS